MRCHAMKLGTKLLILCLLLSCLPRAEAAASGVSYSIIKHKSTKKFAKATTRYRFDQPVLKGDSPAVQRINADLEKEYRKARKARKTMCDNAKNFDKYFFNSVPNHFYYECSCRATYNDNGIICFSYYHTAYMGGTDNSFHYGLSYDLNTGKKLTLTDVLPGSRAEIRKCIYQQYCRQLNTHYSSKSYRRQLRAEINRTPLSRWLFYLKDGKVIVSSGAYRPGGGKGEVLVTLEGNYD